MVFTKKINQESETNGILEDVTQQIDEYFSGRRKEFNVKITLEGTAFQIKVWNELMKIPYGTTISYKDLAIRIGNKNATRAVGSTNGKNMVGIIIPCHRVIGSNGKLTGYAGGLNRKKWLLEHENAI